MASHQDLNTSPRGSAPCSGKGTILVQGYVDPEVLRLRQQADEERELAEARTRFK